jgi:hypothetical protein
MSELYQASDFLTVAELAQFFAPQRVEQQRRENGAVLTVSASGTASRSRLMIADRRRLAFTAFGLRPLDALDRIVGDGVLLT